MKLIATLFFLFLYCFPLFGFNVTLHYCEGHVTSFSIGQASDLGCCCEKEELQNDCCEDKVYSFRVSDDQIKSQQVDDEISKNLGEVTFTEKTVASYPLFKTTLPVALCNPTQELEDSSPPIYILYQVFRI